MKAIMNILFCIIAVAAIGCQEDKQDPRIHLREGIRSSNLVDNAVTRTVAHTFSALIGEGIQLTDAILRRNEAGILELHINGFNRSYSNKRFRYRVEWLDENGLLIESKTNVWLRTSAMGKSPFSFKAVAPSPKAVNFRMDTRKWE